MHIIHLHNIAVNHMGREIFRDLSWVIGDHDRVGLVGVNGAGKSTLMKVLTGEVSLEAGQIVRYGTIHLGYLPQDVTLDPNLTLFETAMILPPPLAKVEAELAAVESLLAQPSVYGNELRLAQVLEQQAEILERYERMNGSSHPAQVRKYLSMLGFSPADYDLPTSVLSGGQKKLLALVQLAVSSPDVLLLDEPDNHLDMEGKRYLERFIQAYHGSVILISHDRYLLDEVATQIVEIENSKLTVYQGNYSAYVTEKELRRLRQAQMYVAQQKEIARIEAAIARFELWASLVVDERHIKQARSRRRMLDKMEERGEIIEKVTEARKLGLEINGWRGSTEAIKLKGVSMAFGDNLLFCDVDLLVRHGERVGLVGANGAGKSVLFKLLLGEFEPYEGMVRLGANTRIGYYSQEHQTLAGWMDKTPLELIHWHKIGGEGQAVSFLMKQMLFDYKQVRQPIKTLSGGERSRLQLALIMLQEPNLLLLDEPTNHLDIASVEVLEAALETFNGAVLTISHDRYFLDNVVDRIVELDGTLKEYIGGYTDYAEAKEKAARPPVSIAARPPVAKAKSVSLQQKRAK